MIRNRRGRTKTRRPERPLYAQHPPAPWTPEYRERVRRAIEHRLRIAGFGTWAFPAEVERRLEREEAGEKRYLFAEDLDELPRLAFTKGGSHAVRN